jgi:hypothetical protein
MRPDTTRHRMTTVGPLLRTRVLVGLSAALALLGCTVQSRLPGPNVILDTPMGPVPLDQPAPAAGPAQAASPGQAVNRDGTYAGTAVVLDPDGGLCLKPISIAGVVVRDRSVRFGGFHGTIDANDGLQMVYGRRWIVGQFEGALFQGILWSAPDFIHEPGCSYIVNLQRIGP